MLGILRREAAEATHKDITVAPLPRSGALWQLSQKAAVRQSLSGTTVSGCTLGPRIRKNPWSLPKMQGVQEPSCSAVQGRRIHRPIVILPNSLP